MSSSSGDIVKNMKIFISQISRSCKKLGNTLSNKAEHAVQSYTARKGNVTALSKTLQTRAMQSNAKHRCP